MINPQHAKQAGPRAVAIHWDGVGVTYSGHPDVEALRPTMLAIETGAHVAITGPSGSGKSTLLNVLGLLDRPTTGRFLLDGSDVDDLSDADRAELRARYFGFVFQRFHLLPSLTACENVELALMYGGHGRSTRRTTAMAALERVGLADRALHRPTALSGGEQQRVAIARAIVRDQHFLLTDEPTGSLDSTTAASVLDLLQSLADDGRGLICVTHNEAVAYRARHRLRVLDGVVSEVGREPASTSP
jgi:putative ABC transport system ATP-binding protein